MMTYLVCDAHRRVGFGVGYTLPPALRIHGNVDLSFSRIIRAARGTHRTPLLWARQIRSRTRRIDVGPLVRRPRVITSGVVCLFSFRRATGQIVRMRRASYIRSNTEGAWTERVTLIDCLAGRTILVSTKEMQNSLGFCYAGICHRLY